MAKTDYEFKIEAVFPDPCDWRWRVATADEIPVDIARAVQQEQEQAANRIARQHQDAVMRDMDRRLMSATERSLMDQRMRSVFDAISAHPNPPRAARPDPREAFLGA